MNLEHPMDAAEESAFFVHIARIERLRDLRRAQLESSRAAAVVPQDQRLGGAATDCDGVLGGLTSGPEATALQGTSFDPKLPALLRRQAE